MEATPPAPVTEQQIQDWADEAEAGYDVAVLKKPPEAPADETTAREPDDVLDRSRTMKCPTDGSTLTMSERAGVEIDYCPECRGVWLDRGELDKILDRATADVPAAPAPLPAPPRDERRPERDRDDRYRSDDRYRDDRYRKPKKKEHWLMEILG